MPNEGDKFTDGHARIVHAELTQIAAGATLLTLEHKLERTRETNDEPRKYCKQSARVMVRVVGSKAG